MIAELDDIIDSFLKGPYSPNDPRVLEAQISRINCIYQIGELKEAASAYESMLERLERETGQGNSNVSLKVRLELATIYTDIVEQAFGAHQTDHEELINELTATLQAKNSSLLLGLVLGCCTRPRRGPADFTRVNSPGDDLIYEGQSGKDLLQRALELRKEGVELGSDTSGDSRVVYNQLGAKACYDLARTHAERGRYNDAVSLQSTVVKFYELSLGPQHETTTLHRGRLMAWKHHVEEMHDR
jgi:tetratricopeptide (TPR) repeat protein